MGQNTEERRPTLSPADDGTTPDPRRWRILAVLLVAIFMSLVGVSIINVVLPSIQRGLDASDSELQWVLTGYALTFGVVLVAAGRAGDILGRGPLFIAGVALFTLSSIAGGLAPDPLSLNIARVLQGLGSGLLNPQAVGMIQQYFRGPERGRAYGALGSVIGVSVAIGPVIGGLIVQLAGDAQGWRWTFLVNVPVGIAAIVLALRWLPRPLRNPRERGGRSVVRELDPVGAVLLGLAVLALLLPFVERSLGPGGWLVLPVAVVLLGVWLWWERRYRDRGHAPMVDLALFRVRSFTTGTLIAGLYFMGVTSVWVLVALYVQNGLGRSALEAGLIGMPAAVLSAFTANWSGRRVSRHGRRIVVAGICSAIVGLGLSIAVVQLVDAGRVSVWWMLLTLAFVGGAQGLVITPNQTITLGEVPLEYAGSAGGVLQTGQRIGTAMGLGVITAVAFAVLDGNGWPLAVTAGFATTAALLLVTLVVAVVDARRGTAGEVRS
ncbi:MFS transporter [Oceanitalea stevensii]|uniref:MFS transporter n=1 Tax=Oceanitalea stevensii TaxID=2763072 RepID=A0ABR8Z623_9MICO|nr:MFS transporter [Oceanitalea stevensii]MBD8063705.1 MFS transporter [Oceanitalea stevensii]